MWDFLLLNRILVYVLWLHVKSLITKTEIDYLKTKIWVLNVKVFYALKNKSWAANAMKPSLSKCL